jgi:hypothetical protein
LRPPPSTLGAAGDRNRDESWIVSIQAILDRV